MQLYKLGADSFLTKGNTKGNDKSFYFHVLRFYIPQIAKATFEWHGLGIGIYTMQGFERQNKESKNILHCFGTTNHNNNILQNNIGQCYDVFCHEINAY